MARSLNCFSGRSLRGMGIDGSGDKCGFAKVDGLPCGVRADLSTTVARAVGLPMSL